MLAGAAKRIGGSLIGGTALAIHLRHRVSFDLDYLATKPFSGIHLGRKLKTEAAGRIEIIDQGQDILFAKVLGVDVQVFRSPPRGSNPGYEGALQDPLEIDGLDVASLPDLLAAKLDVIMYRPKLRDYIDLAAIDAVSPYTLEDGLLFHMRRYGTTPASRELSRILDLLDDPGDLSTDRVFDGLAYETLAYLKRRAPALRRHLYHTIIGTPGTSKPKPPDAPVELGLTPEFDRLLRSLSASPQDAQRRAARVCGHIGARSGRPCILPPGHKNRKHRYQ